MRRPSRSEYWGRDAFLPLNRSVRMLAKRSKRLIGAFLIGFVVTTADARLAMLESNRSEVMVLDALDAVLVAYLSSDKKLSGGFRIFDADNENGG